MDQSVIDRFRALEQKLAHTFPEAQKEAEALAKGITDPRTANADAIWARAWNKPLFANTTVSIGTKMIEKLTPYIDGAWRRWGEKGDAFWIVKTEKGISTDAFKLSPLTQDIRQQTKIAVYRLFAIQGSARAMRMRTAKSETPYADLVDVDLGVMVPTVQSEMGWGWGHITVLHFLTDLGLACKPDLHLVKTVRYLGMSCELSDRKVPNLTDAIAINRCVRSLVEKLDGLPKFESYKNGERLRYVDKILMEISKQGLI